MFCVVSACGCYGHVLEWPCICCLKPAVHGSPSVPWLQRGKQCTPQTRGTRVLEFVPANKSPQKYRAACSDRKITMRGALRGRVKTPPPLDSNIRQEAIMKLSHRPKITRLSNLLELAQEKADMFHYKTALIRSSAFNFLFYDRRRTRLFNYSS